MIKRIGAIFGIIVVGTAFYFESLPIEGTITVLNARAAPMGANGNMFMVTLTMTNEGDAVALTGVRSESGGQAHIMNTEQTGSLVIPANGQGLLAMDGAHMMLSVPNGEFEEGSYQSVSLEFNDGSKVGVRVLRPFQESDGGMMNHDMSQGVEAEPSPAISFTSGPAVNAAGFEVNLALESFIFVRASDDAPHAPNEGHAHVYLNGLKLGRLYEDRYEVGALMPGDYVLRIALNSNDHRPYVAGGNAVEATLKFQID
ncbi:Copper(I)-binding protein [Octadecabacter temperatus]|uniref:Uncharacterized protein n=1 Tax=Octadecabacter temperatus TaxID=1458307 RepID=A0A0K0Y2K5_9RHOB|nr:copper chaperone PCu(A)C [Octadecabacter temperatus]AKS45137.1 hypothetical protein OSB_05760 [Octadecabacter temperatus]SIN86897.1 Copper(I)-binding protein [Octadecabacter temperatus]